MEEVAAVARAKGLSIPDGTVEGLMNDIRKVDGLGLPSSMMMDHYAARPMEVEVSFIPQHPIFLYFGLE